MLCAEIGFEPLVSVCMDVVIWNKVCALLVLYGDVCSLFLLVKLASAKFSCESCLIVHDEICRTNFWQLRSSWCSDQMCYVCC